MHAYIGLHACDYIHTSVHFAIKYLGLRSYEIICALIYTKIVQEICFTTWKKFC